MEVFLVYSMSTNRRSVDHCDHIVMDIEEEVLVEKRAAVVPYQFEPEKSNGHEETGKSTAPLISSRKDRVGTKGDNLFLLRGKKPMAAQSFDSIFRRPISLTL